MINYRLIKLHVIIMNDLSVTMMHFTLQVNKDDYFATQWEKINIHV